MGGPVGEGAPGNCVALLATDPVSPGSDELVMARVPLAHVRDNKASEQAGVWLQRAGHWLRALGSHCRWALKDE